MNKTHTRRKRRQYKQFIKSGAKPKHKLIAGRTGSVHAKKLCSRRPQH